MRAALLLLLATACGLPEGDYFGKVGTPDPEHFRWCNSGEPESVDPALASSTNATPLVHLMFAGLTEYGMDVVGTPEPSIATHWDVSPDQQRFTFHLRKDAKWSNGRPLTAADFVYHAWRVLHPTTLSPNTTPLDPIKNANLYTTGRVKLLMADAPPFRKGEIVEIVGKGGEVATDLRVLDVPSSNTRKSTRALALRDLDKPASEAYATVPAGEEVEILELGGAARDWAYVFHMGLDWRYGWVPLAELDIEPNAEFSYTVREVSPEHIPRGTRTTEGFVPRQGVALGKHLLQLPEVLGIYAEDPHTLVVETWSPLPFLIDETRTRTFRPAPRESVSRNPLGWTRPENGVLVTSGPFHMTSWKVRDAMEFARSESFFAKDLVRSKRFTALHIDDQAASSHIYFQGGCDAMTANNIPYSYLPVISGAKRGGKPFKDFHTEYFDGVYFYIINTEKLTNVHLRRALTMAIDRSPFPRILHGGELPTDQYVPGRAISTLNDAELALCGVTRDTPGVARIVAKDQYCYVPPPGLGFDPEKARAELALAKQEMGADFTGEISVIFNTGTEGHKIVAEYLQEEWRNHLGLDVLMSSMEWKTYVTETREGGFSIARMGWIGGTPDPESEFHNIFKCGSPDNRSRWCSKDYDRLFEQAARTVDRKERLEILAQAEKVLLDEVPIIPLYVYTQKLMTKPYVRDLSVQMGNQPPLFRAYNDPNWQREAAP